MKQIWVFLAVILIAAEANAQTAARNFSFVDYQRTFPRINDAWNKKEDTLQKQFAEKKLVWPAKYVYLRSFKYDSELEVWVKNDRKEPYQLFKTYRVCALAGTLGPKRMQGDYQVPEGFYHINEFNPKSSYHLSLGLNYPNASDRILSDSMQPGGDIYIHGSCVTTGCIPIRDQQIEELYLLAMYAKNEGQDFIPVHIFPIRFDNKNSLDYMGKFLTDFPEYKPMVQVMRYAYEYFNKTHELPVIMVNNRGQYVLSGGDMPEDKPLAVKEPAKKAPKPEVTFDESKLAKVVDKRPEYPGGTQQFQAFVQRVCHDAAAELENGQTKAYLLIEFIIDKDGKPGFSKVIKGGTEQLNEKLEARFDSMPRWKPAVRLDENVPVKLKQTLMIEKDASVTMN